MRRINPKPRHDRAQAKLLGRAIDGFAKVIALKVWWAFNTFQWKHVAFVRSGNIQAIHINGKLVALYDTESKKVSLPPTLGDGDVTVDFWVRIKTFDPKTWTRAQHFAFAKHFRRVA